MREALVYAVGIAVSPVAIAAVLLLLSCRHAVRNAVSFLLGWTVGVAAATVVLVALVNQTGITDSNPEWIAISELTIGAGFLLAALAVLWRRRHSRDELSPPWVDAVDRFTTARSTGLGLVLSGANPKVVALSLGAALSLSQAHAGTALTATTVLLFAAIGTAGASVPLALYLAAPVRAELVLARMRAWLGRRETIVLVMTGVLVSVLFTADGLRGI